KPAASWKPLTAILKRANQREPLLPHSRLEARRIGKGHRLDILHHALTDPPVELIHASRVDPQQHFAHLGLWAWLLLQLELFGPAIAVNLNGLHGLPCHRRSHPLFSSPCKPGMEDRQSARGRLSDLVIR